MYHTHNIQNVPWKLVVNHIVRHLGLPKKQQITLGIGYDTANILLLYNKFLIPCDEMPSCPVCILKFTRFLMLIR